MTDSELDRPSLGRAAATIGPGLLLLAIAAIAARQLAAEDVTWERIAWAPLGLSSGLLVVAAVTVGLRWRSLLATRPAAWEVAAIQCAGILLGYAVPGPVGEVGSAWLLRRRTGASLGDGLAAAFAARLLGVVTAGVLALGLWAACDLPVPDSLEAPVGVVAALLGAGGLAGLAVVIRPDAARSLAGRLGRFADPAQRGIDAVAAVARRGASAWLGATTWTMAGHAAVAGAYAASAWAVGASPSLPGIAFAYAAVTSGAIVLYALPGSQVGIDALVVGLLVLAAGLGLPDALAVAFLIRVQHLGVLCLGAAALWARPAAG